MDTVILTAKDLEEWDVVKMNGEAAVITNVRAAPVYDAIFLIYRYLGSKDYSDGYWKPDSIFQRITNLKEIYV